MKLLLTLSCLLISYGVLAQRNTEIGLAFTNNNTAKPFNKFAGLLYKDLHPGISFSYGYNLSTRKKFDWYQQIKLEYFYHRFVQHGIPLYTNLGYRYKFSNRLSSETSIGAGYMHSIPTSEPYSLQDNGEYKKDGGMGRMQAMVAINLGAAYVVNTGESPLKIFINYQQRLQTPFIKSYVPLLPYNTMMLGAAMNLKKGNPGNSNQ